MMEERRRRRKVAAVIVVAALVALAGSWFAWDRLVRPRTFTEAMDIQLRPGTTVMIEGTITSIRRVNTTYGPEVHLGLDDPLCGPFGDVRGDPNATYQIGDRLQVTAHAEAHTINGDPVVWAKELSCPFPNLLRSISLVWDAVSLVAGFQLRPRGIDPQGWSVYEVVTASGGEYFPDHLPATLRRGTPYLSDDVKAAGTWSGSAWIVWSTVEYVRTSGNYASEPVVDEITRLSDGVSANGTFAYDDLGNDGRLNDGDRIRLRLPATSGENGYETYMFQVGEVAGRIASHGYSGRLVLNGPRGIYEEIPDDTDPTIIHLRYAGDVVQGTTMTSTLEVARLRLGVFRPISEHRFAIVLGTPAEEFTGTLTEDPVSVGGATLDFDDVDSDGLLDSGDRFVVSGLQNRSEITLRLMAETVTVASLRWFVGYGPTSAGLPDITFVPDVGGPSYRVTLDVEYWAPEDALNRTPRVFLSRDGLGVVTEAPISPGRFAPFPGGNLTFEDADGDGVLTGGDAFVIETTTPARFDLSVTVLFGTRTYAVTVGP